MCVVEGERESVCVCVWWRERESVCVCVVERERESGVRCEYDMLKRVMWVDMGACVFRRCIGLRRMRWGAS